MSIYKLDEAALSSHCKIYSLIFSPHFFNDAEA
jgi:hypothetical protein